MNDEYRNNEYIGSDPNSGQLNENAAQNSQGSQSSQSIYSYTGSGIIQDYNRSNSQNYQGYETSGQTYYYTPSETVDVKPRKKRRFGGIMKLAASAVAFGLIAGVGFQGYYSAVRSHKIARYQEQIDALQITEAEQGVGKNDTIRTANSSPDKIVTDVSDVVANVMPAIVAINSTVESASYDYFFGREYTQEAQSSGSGIIIGQNGSQLLLVTNNHVIDGATAIEIVFSDKTTAFASVKGAEPYADLAVLSVDMDSLSEDTAAAIKVATLGDSEEMVPGEMVIAIGNALGYGQSVTVGYVSAVNREITIDNQKMTLLQTDAAINPGNSGGALINTAGEVIGINSVKFASEQVEGMGYAIPISDAIPMINELMNREVVASEEQGFLGINTSTAQEVTDVYAQRFNMPIGIYVNDVVEDSPADRAGLMEGDIITGVDGNKIETIADLKRALSYRKAGQTVQLKVQVMDGGKYVEKVLEVTLGEKQN